MRIFAGVMALLMVTAFGLKGQEYLVPLKTNPNLQHQKATGPDRTANSRGLQSALSLPFIDDFSNRSPYPNPELWEDSLVYVNSTFPIDPPSIGVGTFDAIKANGEPYSYSTNRYGPADTLTSREIDLSALGPADSVILSFFVQPMGNGDPPGSRDTFLLDFKVNDTTWQTMWRQTAASESPDSFRQVFVTLDQNTFFKDNFQFRFRNYSDLTGHIDHWHLDYVILDNDRSVQNRLLNDVAYNFPPRSLLKDYQSMPLNQFVGYEDQELADSIYASASNHFNVVKNTTFRYQATENCGQSVLSTDFFQTINFPALTDTVLQEASFKDDIKGLVNSMPCDSLVIETRYVLFNSPPDPATGFNDTIYHQQRFQNYFAYDDGSVERGYIVTGNSPKLALKFVLNEPDSLQAVRVHFPHIDKNLESEVINLIVWESIDGGSGTDDVVRYREDLIRPEYVDSLNGFTTYRLDSALYMEDSFYVGFQRSGGDTVQVGHDMNSEINQKLFYYTSGSWKSSLLPGTVMIRAVMGEPLPPVSGVEQARESANEPIALYPNPVHDRLTLGDWEQVQELTYELMSINGKRLHQGRVQGPAIDVTMLPKGIHLIRIADPEGGKHFYGKFVKVE